ncbi:MAG: arginyltransferase [Acidobacteriota bacterium]
MSRDRSPTDPVAASGGGAEPAPNPFRILESLRSDEEPCVYLPKRSAEVDYQVLEGCPPEAYQKLLERGWRRFGQVFFRPACATCQECVGLRIDVDRFQPSRSQRRAWRRNRDVRIFLRRPRLSREHLELYEAFHRERTEHRGWEPQEADPHTYFLTFVHGAEAFGYELALEIDGRLVAVALLDLLPRGVSAVYCYYDPQHRHRSLGTFAVLAEIELARSRGIPHVYLGFRVEGNASMIYKKRFQPYQLLSGRPRPSEAAPWSPPLAKTAEEAL